MALDGSDDVAMLDLEGFDALETAGADAPVLAAPVDAEGAEHNTAMADMTVELDPGEGVCVVCDKTFEDRSVLPTGLIFRLSLVAEALANPWVPRVNINKTYQSNNGRDALRVNGFAIIITAVSVCDRLMLGNFELSFA